jgi:hypothetical protein
VPDHSDFINFEMFRFLSINLLPGAVILAIAHIMTSVNSTAQYCNKWRGKVNC